MLRGCGNETSSGQITDSRGVLTVRALPRAGKVDPQHLPMLGEPSTPTRHYASPGRFCTQQEPYGHRDIASR